MRGGTNLENGYKSEEGAGAGSLKPAPARRGRCNESATLREVGQRAHTVNRVFEGGKLSDSWRQTAVAVANWLGQPSFSPEDGAARAQRFYREWCIADRFAVM